jgi:hypothetical protein
MLKKFNNRTLLIVLVALLVVVGIIQIVSMQKGERNFRAYLAQIDTTAVNKFELVGFEKDPIVFEQKGSGWQVVQGEKVAKADKFGVESILQSLADLKVKKRVGVKKEQWRKYDVTDTLGVRMKVYENGDLTADLMIGRFSYKRMGQGFAMSSNARLIDEDEVYTVEGQLSMIVKRDFNGFRDKTLLQIPAAEIQSVKYIYPADSSFTLSQSGSQWMAGDQPVDSTSLDKYFKGLNNVKASGFVDSFNASGNPAFKAQFQTVSGLVEVEAYQEDDKYVLRSTQNEGAVFKEAKNTFEKIFATVGKLTDQ